MSEALSVWTLMEDVLDKLKALQYETKFCAEHHVQPFAHSYFAMEDRVRGEQFKVFLQLVSWLVAEMKQEGVEFEVGEYDDPNTSVTKMMLAIKSCGFSSDVPAMKLKQGHGEAVLVVLSFLCDKVLARAGFEWGVAPQRPKEEYDEDVQGDVQADVGSDIEDEMDAESEGEDVMYAELVREARAASAGGTGKADDVDKSGAAQDHGMIHSGIDPVVWAAELERVGPRLRAPPAKTEEWRGHMEQMVKKGAVIDEHLPAAQAPIEHIAQSISTTLERMSAKEKFINNQFDQLRTEYGQTQSKLTEVKSSGQVSAENVDRLTAELQNIQENLAEVKERMNSRGDSMTDTSPLQQIKKALQKVKEDIKTFELRIGVVGHTLMQAKLRASAGHQARARAARASQGTDALHGDEHDFEMSDEEDF